MSEGNFKKFLVFSAHPDDLDFGCAGSTAKWIQEGNKVVYCILTDGSKGRGVLGEKISNSRVAKIRQKEQKEAAEIVGAKEVIFLGEKDGELERTKRICKKIIETIRKVKPDIVVSFDPGNLSFDNFYLFHRDHRISAELVFDAVYPAVGSMDYFPELHKNGVSAHNVHELWFYGTDKPNMFVDITQTINTKCNAISHHKSQFEDVKGVCAMVRQRAKEAGKEHKVSFAETFRKITF